MAQKTNLNINPYFDDFNSENNFYKVLFKPGFPVQSRELTTLQSILQNQIEDFGSHMFAEGSMVIPGNITYDNQFYAVKVNPSQFGVDVSIYIDKFVGKTITGQVSGVTAKIQKVVLPTESDDVEYITLYVKYLESNSNFEFTVFEDGEQLTCNTNIVYGNTTIASGTAFSSTISANSTSIGSAVSIGDGVYFVRGYFASVSAQNIILDYYTNFPSYRVGLRVTETLVSAKEDESLFDNAKGFTNYAAPGADRLKIDLTLTKKSLDDTNDTDFVELLRVKNGKIKKVVSKTTYNKIRDYFAERTFDESGDYTVKPFELSLDNSLNDRIGNDGVFFADETTEQGNIPTKDKLALEISPGKAYVRGYDIEKSSATIIDVDKPRDVGIVTNITVPVQMGNVLRVQNVSGVPKVRETVDLLSQHDSTQVIGQARVYSFNLTDSRYLNATTSWDLRLYDIQTYSELLTNVSDLSDLISTGYYIKGKSSGASGYVVSVGSGSFFLRQTSGSFSLGETLLANGIEIPVTFRDYQRKWETRDVVRVRQTGVSDFPDFSADVVLDTFIFPGGITNFTITGESAGVSTLTAPNLTFGALGVRSDVIIRYNRQGTGDEVFNRIKTITELNTYSPGTQTNTEIQLEAITSVSGVFEGSLPAATTQVEAYIGAASLRGTGTLYAPLPEQNAASIDLSNSQLYISEQIVGKDVDNSTNILTLDTNTDLSSIPDISWATFDQERYTVAYSGGGIGTITSDTFNLSGSTITIRELDSSLSSNDTVVNVTAIKNKIKSKIKNYSRSRVLLISGSKLEESGNTENTSKNDGLTFNNYYGLRVQDEEISLNYPDVVKVLCIHESLDSSNSTLDEVQFTSTANVGSNAILGENIIGEDSGCVARVVTNNTSSPVSSSGANNLGVIYLNQNKFSAGETVRFEDSNIRTTVESIVKGSYRDITSSFELNRNQKNQYYDYSKLDRKKSVQEPKRRLLIVFDHYTVDSNDDGDAFTVNSYDEDRFESDIPNIAGSIRATDTIDFRPRVSYFDPTVTTDRSPFDFTARTSSLSSGPTRLLRSGEGSLISQEYYLPRVDKVYLDSNGKFIIDKGVSSKNPKEPVRKSDVLELATISYPAYLYNPSDASITVTDNRRYTMRDIGNIEQRVENLERVTSLTLLETSVETLEVQDSEGRNRFKSGFFVDDFSDTSRFNQVLSTMVVDTNSKILHPDIARDTVESLIATKDNLTPDDLDLSEDMTLLDSSIQKTGRALTLAYDEIGWLEQPFATKVENVNPFNVVVYTGSVELDPEVDNWTRTVQLPDRNVDRGVTRTNNVNLVNSINAVQTRTVRVPRIRPWQANNARAGDWSFRSSSTTRDSFDTVNTTIRNEVVGSVDDRFMRSRNTEFRVSTLKPNTRFYQFIENRARVDVIPKLIEIAKDKTLNTSGASAAFIVGETVIGRVDGVQLIDFRVCSPEHKQGRFNNPSLKYTINPYNKSETIGNVYSSTSKVLNVDTLALSRRAQGRYSGYIEKGMQLVGQTSGAVAYVKDIRLISDNYGDLIGSFFIRDPLSEPRPAVRITTGTKTYRITSSSTNDPGLPGSNEISFAETNYTATGTVQRFRATVTNETTRTNITSTVNVAAGRQTNIQFYDPLAQTFTVGGNIQVKSDIDTEDDANGVFLTSVDLFFASIDSGNAEVKIEVRTTLLGTPTLEVIGRPVILRPNVDTINVSSTGEVATNVKFPEPIYLAPGREYAIVIISDKSDEYELWTAVMGEETVNTQSLPDVDQTRYTKQFALGTLFKSQNGSIWTTNQYQDLKFKLYKAQFTSTQGTAYFYNAPLDSSNGYVPNLINNPITVLPKTGKIGITTTHDSDFIGIVTVGRRLAGVKGNGGSAIITGTGSSVSSVSIDSRGYNYPVSVTDEVVDAYAISGKGEGLKLIISTDSDGRITGVAHSTLNPDYGNGFRSGDLVGIVTSSTSTQTGSNGILSIDSISGLDTLYLTNVQGEFSSNSASGVEFVVGTALSYFSGTDGNTIVSAAGTVITRSSGDGGVYSGNYMRVEHFNHGMYSNTNKLKIDNIQSDVPTTTLSADLSTTETNTISVASTANFVTFEGQNVSTGYTGYVKIGGEIIGYDNYGSGSLTITDRGVDGTIIIDHPLGSEVEKYEFGGVSLRRINGITTSISSPIELDSYHVEIGRNVRGHNRSGDAVTANTPQLSFNDEKTIGGDNVTASENIIFDSIIPTYDIATPGSLTSIEARIRTVSGTSVDGSESSFNDNGYENVQINTLNPLDSVRLVSSEENSAEYLTSLPRQKPLTTAITFTTSDENLSPILNLDTAFSELYSNRINKPINDYVNDRKVNSIIDDPHASVYYSNEVNLENPASTLKVILSAERMAGTDFRVLYRLITDGSSEVEQAYQLFPGYNVTDDREFELNRNTSTSNMNATGLPDRKVRDSVEGEYLEYEFTKETEELFTGFSIKIVSTSTNQAYAPKFADLRVIALR